MSGWWWWAVRQGEGCTAVSDGRHGADGSGLESGQRTDRGGALWLRTQALKNYRVNFEICMAKQTSDSVIISVHQFIASL